MEYNITIGLEIHCQINTKTKMFCRCSADSFNADPNSNICPICMGFPGQLPVINKEAVKKGIIAGLALGCTIPEFSKFDRKNYFYPDSPKGFQISQYDQPIATNGAITIETSKGEKTIAITRLHLEDDAGKLTHTKEGTLCDFNRAGTPLMEIVSEPEMHSLEEASQYAREIQKIMRYVDSSNADMEKGMMRFDLNISLNKESDTKLGTKVEIKNLNSFQSLEKAIEFETERQSTLLNNNESISAETRGWDEATQKTISQRSKEDAQDYRYFPEPDLPPLIQDPIEIQKIKEIYCIELPLTKKKRFKTEYKLTEDESRILSDTPSMAQFFEEALKFSKNPKTTASFITTILLKHLNENELTIEHRPVSAKHLGELITLIDQDIISNNIAKTTVFDTMYKTQKAPHLIIEEQGLKQVSDTGTIEKLCQEAINQNQQALADYQKGNTKALGAIIGTVMKLSQGQANPKLVNDTILKLIK